MNLRSIMTMTTMRRLKQISMVCQCPLMLPNKRFTSTSTHNISNPVDNAALLKKTFQDIHSHLNTSEVRCNAFMEHYQNLQKEQRGTFLSLLGREYGADQESIASLAYSITTSQDKTDESSILSTCERLRAALRPRYKTLFIHLGRVLGGVKFLVDLRADVLSLRQTTNLEVDAAVLQELNSTLREILLLWFTVGFLNLERITWSSPCDLVQKVSNYEAVHRIRTWEDIKRRVGPYRRCYIFTHSSMPREPVVVLHTALTQEISSNIQAIIHNKRFWPSPLMDETSTDLLTSNSALSTPDTSTSSQAPNSIPLSSSIDLEKEDPSQITCAVFYSITSTQKGLQGIDLGNYLIKSVVRKLQEEFPSMSQYSSLSPIPGFRDWLITTLNHNINVKDSGEDPGVPILLPSEVAAIVPFQGEGHTSPIDTFKEQIVSHQWIKDPALMQAMKTPLMRLCAHYLYVQKRRAFALNPVAHFHLSNGATMWRINFLADNSARGLNNSCTMMVNYRYFLDKTESNSRLYLENHQISVSDSVMELLNVENEKMTTY